VSRCGVWTIGGSFSGTKAHLQCIVKCDGRVTRATEIVSVV
jgi:hypothetical protein